MKRNLLKLFIVGSVVTSFLFVLFFGLNVHAEEPTENQEPTTQEVENTTNEEETPATTNEQEQEEVVTDEESKKINDVFDFIKKLDQEELLGIINDVKGWFIAIGITGVVSLLAALIGLIAAITKLKNEKIRNSNLSKEEQDRRIADNNNTKAYFEEEINGIKLLLLDFINGLDDEEKEKVKSNTASVKARILELEKSINKDEE